MSLIPEAGFLIIKREPETIWKNLPDQDRQSIIHYRGFDGRDRWPLRQEGDSRFDDAMVPLKEFEPVLNYYGRARQIYGNSVDLLFISAREPENHLEGFVFIGYDVGLLSEEGEPTFFSVILNEVRPGGNAVLSGLAVKLNRWYLFEHEAEARSCLGLRRAAIEAGEEDYLEVAYRDVNDVVRISLYMDSRIVNPQPPITCV